MPSPVKYQSTLFGLLFTVLVLLHLIAAQTCGAGCAVPGCETCADFGVIGSIHWCKCCTYDCGGARSNCISQYQFCTGSSGRCYDVAGSCFSTPVSTRASISSAARTPVTTLVGTTGSSANAESATFAWSDTSGTPATALNGSTEGDMRMPGTTSAALTTTVSSTTGGRPFVDTDGAAVVHDKVEIGVVAVAVVVLVYV